MQFKIHGCRGSIPVAGQQYAKYGGNTTCIRVISDQLPEGVALILDAGSGLVPASREVASEGVEKVYILFTHYHWDHTIGLTLSPLMFMKHIDIVMGGPVQDGIGTEEMCTMLFKQPFFPKDYREIASHISHMRFHVPSTKILLFHRTGGFTVISSDRYERLLAAGAQMPFESASFNLDECLVIRMHRSNHPEQTISFRVEERATGQSFALLTDHENQDGIPNELKAHLKDVGALIADCQYTRSQYDSFTAGFGHGTPDYVVRLAHIVGARRVLLTHHDPGAGDDRVEEILAEAMRQLEDRLDGEDPGFTVEPSSDGSTYDL